MKKIHLICNAHIDPVWLWEWEEGAAEAISTFRVAADFCEKYDGFVFNHNEVILYRWVEEYEPELFQRIKKLVAKGKWHIMGGWFLQPDCNIPSGESFVRQILLGRNYFRSKFKKEPTTAINFDPFGHTRGLVQIMAKSGYDSYLFCRPHQQDCELPADAFVWEGYDGSKVKGLRAYDMYLSLRGEAVKKVNKVLDKYPDSDLMLVLWGIGNHGGGPSRIDLEALNKFADDNKKTLKIVHSTPEAFFKELDAKKLPVHKKDLNKWAVGCYTSQVRIKQQHRKLENEMYSTEKMLSNAWAQGLLKYPENELKEAEMDLANSEFHDILPGSSIQPVEDTSLRLIAHGQEILSRLKARAFFALSAGQAKAKDGMIPILVHNPHPYPVSAVIDCEFNLPDQNWKGTFFDIKVYDGAKALPSQVEKEYSNLHLDWRKKVVFLAELKPSQMNRFDCKLVELPAMPEVRIKEHDGRFIFKDAEKSVVISAKTGLLESYKVGGQEFIGKPSCLPIVLQDNEDSWKMAEQKFGKKLGEFKALSEKESAYYTGTGRPTLAPVRVIEDGDTRTVVEALFGYDHSYACIQYKIPKKGTEIEISVRLNWSEKNKLVKLTFNSAAKENDFIGQVAFGAENFPVNGQEVVYQKWAVLKDRNADKALSVIDDSIYGGNFRDNELGLSLLRSPAYSGHPFPGHEIVRQDRFIPRHDQGERLYTFWLNAGGAKERLEAIDREALAKNERPMAVSFFPRGANVKKLKNFLKLSDKVIQMTAVKKSTRKDNALIVRLFEPTGKGRGTKLVSEVLGISKTLNFKPFEVKTIEIAQKTKTVREVSLIEQ